MQHPFNVESYVRQLQAERLADAERQALLRTARPASVGLRTQLARLFLGLAFRLDETLSRTASCDCLAPRTPVRRSV